MSAERWRKPVIPLRIEQLDQGIWLPDGRIHGGVQLTLASEDIERIRQGYVCAKCLEPHEAPWPERCHLCGSPMRTSQAEYFAREFAGEVVLRRRDWDEEFAGLEERRRKEDEERARNHDQ